MDRRTFIRDVGGGLLLWAAGWRADVVPDENAASSAAARGTIGIAVFDPTLESGRRFAHEAVHVALHRFALDEYADIGALWHARIAALIAPTIAAPVACRAPLAVALRPADRFVLERLAATFGCQLIDA